MTVDAKASDPIPHIIDGIVIHVRDIRVYIDRPEFMINPTNCDPMSFAATVDGAGADFTNPADQVPVTVTNSFQMANCQNLQFKPTFKVSTSGKPSRLDGESLSVKLDLPQRAAGHPDEHQARQSRPPQAAALAADDAAEGVSGSDVRGEPRAVPRGLGDRARDRDHADPARCR